MNKLITSLLFSLGSILVSASEANLIVQDTLHKSITPEQAWWDLTYYHLDIKVDPDHKTLSGKNTIYYKVLKGHNVMQIDLQPPLKIEKVLQNGKELKVKSNANAYFINLKAKQKKNNINSLTVFYSGKPKQAINAPWDGGISWKKDTNGKHFVASSCQGIGASIWWPNKDQLYDEVDSLLVSINVPENLINVSNGRLRKIEEHSNGTKTFHWFVGNPINNYNVTFNIGDYVHFSEKHEGEKGTLDMNYYVLRDNLEKAKVQFQDALRTIKVFEHWFGPYPFYEDSFKLVEAPFLGMEHQSSIAYGNRYNNGYWGYDLSHSGWGLKFDYIIIHESGHEWFGNNITNKYPEDLWIHESFTTYSESLFVEYYFGKKAAQEFIMGIRKDIKNNDPIIGIYDANHNGDVYNKGANMLHTLRQLIEDDEKWRAILRGLNTKFYHQTVTTKQIEEYVSKQSKIDLTQFFDQYLRTAKIPTLEYTLQEGKLKYRYTNIVKKFDMPVRLFINDVSKWVQPNADWQTIDLKVDKLSVDPNFYVNVKSL